VIIEAFQRIQHPEPIRAQLFLIVAAGGLLVNLVSLRILHGMREANLNTRGAYLHVLGDALGSVGALSAAAVIMLTGWTLADPIISIALAVLILIGGWRLLRESTDILLEGVPGHLSMVEVQRRMLGVAGVTGVHDLHVWTVTSGMVAMSGHAIVPELGSHPEVLEGIRVEMARLGIAHVTIQLEVQHECEEPRAVTSSSGHAHHPRHTH
jgi:cobalt-zinc-cadmium efflux system protein